MGKEPNKRQQQAEQTKQKLYKNAIKLFQEKGYSAVTVEEICKKSNVSKGAFYVHFSSKHDIVVTQSKRNDEAQMAFYNAMDKSLPYTEQIIKFAEFICRNIAEDKGLDAERAIYTAEMSKTNPPQYICNKNRPLYKIFEKIFAAGQKAGEFREDISGSDAVEVFIMCIRGVIYEWIITIAIEERDIVDMCHKFASAIVYGYKKYD
jgi:AcrR family transcriptional regulator